MTNSHDEALLIAPELFVFAKERKKVRPGTSGPAAFMWHTLTEGANTLHPRRLLPVFFSPESRENFIQKYYIDHGMTPPAHLSIDPFALAEAIEFLEEEGVELVAPDPVGFSGGSFTSPYFTLPYSFNAAYYRRVMLEMRPGLERLFAENVAGAEDGMNDPADLQKVKERCAAGIEGVLWDAHARAAEWERQWTPPSLP
ncbi:MAG TPA: hypothetical protein VI055_11930 [Rubrobacter sp.]